MMQLVLFEDIVFCRESYYLDIEVSDVHIYQNDVTWYNCRDDVAEQLIAELFNPEPPEKLERGFLGSYFHVKKENSELKITLEPEAPCSGLRVYSLRMMHSEGDNILKSLRNRFYDKVKISVTLGKSEDGVASTEEMTICRKHECLGSIDLNLLPAEYCVRAFNIPMKITADISLSDDDILASLQAPWAKKIFEDALFTDVMISTKDGTEVKAHKCFLSAASPVLRAAFSSEFEESKTGKLDMSDMTEKAVNAFLRYVYYRDLYEAKEDMQIAFELLCAGHKYNVMALETWGIWHFLDKEEKDFPVEMAFTIYPFVRNIEGEAAVELKKKTAGILMSKVDEMETLTQYKELSEENPNAVTELCKELTDLVSASPTPSKKQKLSK